LPEHHDNAPRAFEARVRAGLVLLVLPLLILGIASCAKSDSPTGPGDGTTPTPGTSLVLDDASTTPFQLVTATVRGSTVPDVDIRARVGADSVSPVRLDDSTVAFYVPEIAAGAYQVILEFNTKRIIGTLTVTALPTIADPVAYTDSVLANLDFLLAATLSTDSTTVFTFDSVLTAARAQLAAATPAERAEVARFLSVNLQEPAPVPSFLDPGQALAIGAEGSGCTCTNWAAPTRTYESCALNLPAKLNEAHNRVLLAGVVAAASAELLKKPRGWSPVVGGVGVAAAAAILLSTVDGAFCTWAHPIYANLASLNPFSDDELRAGSRMALITGGGVFIDDTTRRYDVRARYASPTATTENTLASEAAVWLESIGEEWDALAAKLAFMPPFPGVPTTSQFSTVRLVPPEYLVLGPRTPATVSGSAEARDSTWHLTFSMPNIGNNHTFSFPVEYTGPGVSDQFGTVDALLKPIYYPVKRITIAPDDEMIDIQPQTGRLLTVTMIDSLDRPVIDREVTWTSSQDTVVSVNQSGSIFGIKEGLSVVTVRVDGVFDQVVIKVEPMPVDSVDVVPDTSTIGLGASRLLEAITYDSLGRVLTGRIIRWTSADPSVARVDSITGRATAVSGGYTTMTATSEGKSGTGVVRVIVGAVDVSSGPGADHHCAVATGNAAIYCWGSNAVGQLGDGTGVSRNIPVLASAVPVGISGVVAGLEHSCGLDAAGAAWCWGGNDVGQLGTGVMTDYEVPAVAVAGGLTFTKLTAGTYSTCGVATSGQAYCWGERAISISDRAYDVQPTLVPGGHSYSDIKSSAGNAGTCGLTTGGSILCWGNLGWENAGTAYFSATPRLVGGGRTYTALAVGAVHQCGVSGSDIWCWSSTLTGVNGVADSLVHPAGSEPFANAGVPFQVSGGASFTDVVAGKFYTCGLTNGGSVWCWGSVDSSVPVAASPTGVHDPYKGAFLTSAGSGFTKLGAGGNSICGLKDGGIVWCWGSNSHGQMGNGSVPTPGSASVPQPVQDPNEP
jgi:hypothetical protein